MRAHLVRIDPVLVQAVIAAALSFAHLHDLASAAGQDGWKAWAYPISVDLLLVAAWRRLRSGENRATGWGWFLIALSASLGANIATAGLLDLNDVPAWLRILVAGWPALAFLGGTLLAHSVHEPAPATASEAPADVRPEPALAAETAAALPEDVPEPTEQVPAPVPVPAALVEHAQKVADAHRARTGSPIDADTLRARLGVPAPLARQVAIQLT
ncbi:DUF2637 domain-containing protein [Streptomyces albus]|uniref:DUF2637 domain-containing protein n=1 Tax=Streptomyces albus TaxID=1888 RepID=UPI0033C2C523